MSRPGITALIVLCIAFLFYLAGLAPDVLWGDMAEFQANAARLEFEAGPRGYPLYRLLSHAAAALPVGNLAYRVNLLSAACASAAVALLYLAASRMGLDRPACLVAAGALAVSHEFWSQAVLAEVYALNALLLAALALLLLDRRPLTALRMVLAGAVLAAGCFHHQTILFLYPPCLVVLVLRRSEVLATRRSTTAALAAITLAAGPALLLVLGGVLGADGGLANALSGGARSLPFRISYAGRLLALNFPSPALPLVLLGAWTCARRIREPSFAFLLSSAGLLLLFPLVLRWYGDQHVFLLPAFLFLSLLAGIGAGRVPWRGVLRSLLVAAVLLMPPAVYFGLATWFSDPGAPLPFAASRAYARCFFWPPKAGYRHPREFTEGALRSLPEGASLVCTWGEGKTARYLQEVDGIRTDVKVALARTARAFRAAVAGARLPVYVTRYPYFADHRKPYALPPGFRYERHEAGATLIAVIPPQ